MQIKSKEILRKLKTLCLIAIYGLLRNLTPLAVFLRKIIIYVPLNFRHKILKKLISKKRARYNTLLIRLLG